MPKKRIEFQEKYKIIEGLEKAYEKLVIYKRKMNYPMIISENGEVKAIDPFEVAPTTKYLPSNGVD